MIADVLGSIEDPLPDDAVQMLHWLATEHEDPTREAWTENAGGGQKYFNGDIPCRMASIPCAVERPTPFGILSSPTPHISTDFVQLSTR